MNKCIRGSESAVRVLIVLAFLTASASLRASTDTTDADKSTHAVPGGRSLLLFPSTLTFHPPLASPFEPHFGIIRDFEDGSLLADIGNAAEIIRLLPEDDGATLAAAAEFFARAYVTEWQGFHLQVDAIDGFFGGNIVWSKPADFGNTAARFRFIHHSSHLADGHLNSLTGKWKDGREPAPWTKDQFELLAALSGGSWRVYGGVNYATRTRPASLKPLSGSAGFEYAPFFNAEGWIHPFIAYDFRLDGGAMLDEQTHTVRGTDAYVGAHSILAGASIGAYGKRSLRIFLHYHAGTPPLSEYMDVRTPYIGAGFDFEYF